MASSATSFRTSPLRVALRAVYDEVGAHFAGAECDNSTDCCRFAVTGREPYPTAIERAEIALALADRGGLPKRVANKLPMADAPCALLTDAGRCAIYAARPLGCRTFFCERARFVPDSPRSFLRDVSSRLARLSEQLVAAERSGDPGPVPMRNAVRR